MSAAVSPATVSRVLNGGAVADATAARVREAASRLEYTPNALTKSIFAGRSSTIGVVSGAVFASTTSGGYLIQIGSEQK